MLLLSGFILILLGPGLCLMSAIAIGTRGFSFLVLFCVLSYFSGFLKNLNRVCLSSLSHNPLLLYRSPVHVAVRC